MWKREVYKMYEDRKIRLAQEDSPIYLLPSMANRHGLIAGATGTGKTITMKVMAESFSDMGVPVFLADIKGDLSGMCEKGKDSEDMRARIARFGLDGFEYKSYPTRFWDIFGDEGHPVRVTVSSMGPTSPSRRTSRTGTFPRLSSAWISTGASRSSAQRRRRTT